MNEEQKKISLRIAGAVILVLGLWIFTANVQVEPWVKMILFLSPYWIVGYDILWDAIKNLSQKRFFDDSFLVMLATFGAFALGHCKEAVAVMIFFRIGALFEDYAVQKSKRKVNRLMDIRQDYVNIEERGALKKMSPAEIKKGTVIVVMPGEKVPIDGVVVKGKSTVDMRALTGAGRTKEVKEQDEVLSGSLNLTEKLYVQTTTEFRNSTASKLFYLMESACTKTSKIEKRIENFVHYFTPLVCGAALVLAVVPPAFRLMIMKTNADWGEWCYRALTFLIISCPCALMISIPLCFFAGIAGAGADGIFIKGFHNLEDLANVKTAVFDKTGTMTEGVFEVCGIHEYSKEDNTCLARQQVVGYSKKEEIILEYAALAESCSRHPISRSIRNAYGKKLEEVRVCEAKEIRGFGVTAIIDGHSVVAGNDKLMKQMQIPFQGCSDYGTIVYVAIDGQYAGHIQIADVLKDHSAAAVLSLKQIGVKRTVLMTGDEENSAEKVAADAGIREVYSGLLTEDKESHIEKLKKEKEEKATLMYVGDGVNDVPVLSKADIGVALGALGEAEALESADVILMDDDILRITKAVQIAQKCMTIVRENICFILGVKAFCLLLGAFGIVDMWTAVLADVVVLILAMLNSIRALFIKRL